MALRVRIGHASKDEDGKVKGGAAGDQTGKEVCIRDWYLHGKGWICFRCKDVAVRELIAEAVEKACNNPLIGYDQNQRNTLYNAVKTLGFDPSKVTKPVEVDCSKLVQIAIAYGYGEDIVGDIRTAYMPEKLMATGKFIKLTSDDVCKSSDYLVRGDILVTPVQGHTVVVLDNGAKVPTSIVATEPARAFDPALEGMYKTTGSLNIRNGAGTSKNDLGKDKSVLVTLPKGAEVKCFGSYNLVGERKWPMVHFAFDGVTYVGFASSGYLTKA